MAGQNVDFESQWQQLVARAWADDAFKKKLLADPAGVLKEHGLIPPAGKQIKVMENTDKMIHLILPAKPAAAELSEQELQSVAGGWCGGCGHERCRWERCGGGGWERCGGGGWERCGGGGWERCRRCD
jgi:hypothetical protein